MANSIDLSQFHEIFYEESYEGLEAMEAGLLKLDQGSTEPEVVNTVFRAAHSIKGSAGTFGFTPISDYTHVVETLLDEVRSDSREVTKALIDVLLKSVDYMRYMINETKAGKQIDTNEVESRVAQLNQFASDGVVPEDLQNVDATSSPKAVTPDVLNVPDENEKEIAGQTDTKSSEPEVTKVSEVSEVTIGESAVTEPMDSQDNFDPWLIVFKPHSEMMLTGNDPFRFIRELRELGDPHAEVNTRNLPEWDRFDPEFCYLAWEVQLPGEVKKEDIEEIFEWIVDDCVLTIEKISDDLSADIVPDSEDSVASFGVKETIGSTNPRKSGGVLTDERNQEITSIRVNIDKVDNLVNLVGELVITQSILHQFAMEDKEVDLERLQEGLGQLERNTRQLQEETMRIRMLPIDSVFQRLPRLVRDLSGSLGKKVEMKMRGNQTEVDKTVLEKIADPLMHLIRNSMDHGLEKPEDRIKIGKPETGLVDLNAYHEGGNIILEIMDDGAGLNKEKIREKAVQKGLIRNEEDISDAQIYRMIFAPGFTTADQLSDVSGRGVGMDVVNKNISDLGGSIDVSSVPGAGCIFTIKLPLTLAIVDSQLVRVGKETLIVPLLSIVKSVQINENSISEIAGESPVYRYEDEYVPVISLNETFGIHIDEDDKDRILVIVDVGQKVGLLVNEVVGLQQVVIKTLEANYKQIEGVAGATILGDGKVAMIVDIGGLIRQEEQRHKGLLAVASS